MGARNRPGRGRIRSAPASGTVYSRGHDSSMSLLHRGDRPFPGGPTVARGRLEEGPVTSSRMKAEPAANRNLSPRRGGTICLKCLEEGSRASGYATAAETRRGPADDSMAGESIRGAGPVKQSPSGSLAMVAARTGGRDHGPTAPLSWGLAVVGPGSGWRAEEGRAEGNSKAIVPLAGGQRARAHGPRGRSAGAVSDAAMRAVNGDSRTSPRTRPLLPRAAFWKGLRADLLRTAHQNFYKELQASARGTRLRPIPVSQLAEGLHAGSDGSPRNSALPEEALAAPPPVDGPSSTGWVRRPRRTGPAAPGHGLASSHAQESGTTSGRWGRPRRGP